MSEIRKGDQIKVTVEGTVTYKSNRGVEVLTATGQTVDLYADGKVLSEDLTIEKIEPPVEVFKPGDVVRGRLSGALYTLGDDHYIAHRSGITYAYDCDSEFTSHSYEKVNLVEAPF